MVAGPRPPRVEALAWATGAAKAGPPSSATPERSGGTSYPPYVYSFWDDTDQRCLYVGKAGPGPSGPALRIQSHYLTRKPWALAATTIRVQAFPGAADNTVLDIEAARIAALRPRGNQVHNRRHHDRAWMLRTEVAHARANGVPVALGQLAGVWWATMTARVRQGARLLGQVLAVDVVLAIVGLLIWAAVS